VSAYADTSTTAAHSAESSVQPRRLKIALVVHDLHAHGGQSLYTKILADELARRHEVAVFANSCERPADAGWESRHVRAWRARALTCVKTFPLGLRSHAAALDDYEIRHMQGYCGGSPNVVTAHRCMASYLRSLSALSLRHRVSLRIMLNAESRFYRNYEGTVIAISRQVASELQEFYGLRGRIRIIPHGVDFRRFKSANRLAYRAEMRRRLGIKEEQLIALYVGDLTKAHVHLKELSRAAPDIQLVIVSASGSYHWRAPNVRIFPLTKEIERYYAAADAFVFPSVNDPFGLVVLEAMASGLAVFSSDQAGAAELIDSGSDGFVMPLDEWTEATADRLRNRTLLQDIGSAAEQTARAHGWPAVVSAVEKLYLEVAA
jgi:UDP-glucose:(heptosyl)LPS alpha-1,3-glucosyltransferase